LRCDCVTRNCFFLAQLEDVEVGGADYAKPLPLGNFRGAWEELAPETEQENDYGLGPRENLQVCGCQGCSVEVAVSRLLVRR